LAVTLPFDLLMLDGDDLRRLLVGSIWWTMLGYIAKG